ncbi:hypothetical protein GSI_04339 [Ganoderma sinense ZZ0214-1]|uniref:DUF6533 domain-containing protein n=1 Tax=Ganoderma sinense ZZ0214-1 TaxID=1077348 RepID=A0A2G8SIX2_9APHY|nr:hypothetical protein GSI_04339 [Ganoderma sinense ZZ0214-1]
MLPLEGRRIWKRKFTGATVVYLLNRYTALFRRIFFIMEALSWNRSDQRGLTHADDALLVLNYFAFAAFTVIRVYAVWGRDWKPLLVVIPLSLARPVLFMASSVLYVPVQGGPLAGYPLTTLPALRFEMISVATTVTSEGIFLALTWVRTYGIKKDWSRLGVHTPLTTLLLRDGTAYFVTLFPSKVLAIISDLNASPTLFLRVWPYFDEALTVCFLCRFMLDLRGVYFSDDLENELLERTAYLSNLRFSSSAVGNLDASLGGRLHHEGSDEDMSRGFDSLPSSLPYDDYDDD